MDNLLNRPLTDEQVNSFNEKLEALEDEVLGMITTISFATDGYSNINAKVEELTKRLTELSGISKEIIMHVDELVVAPFDKKEVETRMDRLRDNLVELKRKQIDKYNAMADMYNIRLGQLRNVSNIPEDVKKELDALGNIEKYTEELKNYMQNNYMNVLKYDKLLDGINKLIESAKNIGMTFNYIRDFNEIEINSIINRTNAINVELKDIDGKTDEQVDLTYKKLKDLLVDVDDLQILVKTESIDEVISKDDENGFLSRLDNLRKQLLSYSMGGE